MSSILIGIAEFIGEHTLPMLLGGIALAVISVAVALSILVWLPADYLRSRRNLGRPGRSRSWKVAKNVLGAALVAFGAILSLPAVPGPGLLTILAGIILLDIPGKTRIVQSVLGKRPVLSSINRMRARFARPPLRID